MARKPRNTPGGIVYHVMNRTWGRHDLFEDDADYAAFEHVLTQALERDPTMRLCSFCLMPNHFHLLLWPTADGALSRFMQWVTMTHTQRWHAHRHSAGRGHLYQSRFKSFPVQDGAHFLKVCRYVERNPVRANLVPRAERWRWSALGVRTRRLGELSAKLSPWPSRMPGNWLMRVNEPQDERELAAIRHSTARGRPYGTSAWTLTPAKDLGIDSSLRPVGRPVKRQDGEDVEK
jgi:putative transposase